jgi:hypothetical protein
MTFTKLTPTMLHIWFALGSNIFEDYEEKRNVMVMACG